MCLSSLSARASHFGAIPCVVVCLFYLSMSSVGIETTVSLFTLVYLESVQFERMNKFHSLIHLFQMFTLYQNMC